MNPSLLEQDCAVQLCRSHERSGCFCGENLAPSVETEHIVSTAVEHNRALTQSFLPTLHLVRPTQWELGVW